jgi:excisionase family DNA binding protein
MRNCRQLPETGFVRLTTILAPNGPIPVSKSTWWAGIKVGRYPKPVKLGPRTRPGASRTFARSSNKRARPMSRRLNPRLVKIHRNYTVEEAARTLRVHRNTVRNWVKQGLPTIDSRRPTLIHGEDLRGFLQSRRRRSNQSCGPDQLYCVKCRLPKRPVASAADYIPITAASGNLRGICPNCGCLMHRRVARASVCAVTLKVSFPQAGPRIRESATPSPN